ncbi:MAG: hypothetical protein ACRD4B_08260, partial [Acidobacteriota bacterium]
MPRYKHYTQLVIFDTLAVIFMIGAILTGWLPVPGGIPLFIIGLSLLAINHEWAEKYIDLLRKYADKLGDLIFLPRLRLAFDILSPALVAAGILLVVYQDALWMLTFGIFGIALGVVAFL